MTESSAAQKAYRRRYNASPKGKSARAKYRRSKKGKASIAAYQAKYRKTAKGKACTRRRVAKYRASSKGRLATAMAEEKRAEEMRKIKQEINAAIALCQLQAAAECVSNYIENESSPGIGLNRNIRGTVPLAKTPSGGPHSPPLRLLLLPVGGAAATSRRLRRQHHSASCRASAALRAVNRRAA